MSLKKEKAEPFLLLLRHASEQMSEGEMTEEDAEEETGSSDLLSDGFTGISERV